ncbi:hypothetical protein Tco_0924429 [Tanacetum coccineum]|uniref:Uncharacterized protein n=1 Tax=Tanacetum coccineum TaxID=301880 RepID=A0ABQ5D3T7_9ASTR
MESNDGAILCESNLFQEIRLKMNLPDHRIKLWWKWRYLVPVESIHSPMLTLNVFNQRHHDNRKTYNTASATLISSEAEVPQDEGEHKESVPTPSNDPQPSEEDTEVKWRKMSRPTDLKRLRKIGMTRRVESSEDQESLGAPEDASKIGRCMGSY